MCQSSVSCGLYMRSWAERRQKLVTSARTCNIVGSDKIPLANNLLHSNGPLLVPTYSVQWKYSESGFHMKVSFTLHYILYITLYRMLGIDYHSNWAKKLYLERKYSWIWNWNPRLLCAACPQVECWRLWLTFDFDWLWLTLSPGEI